MKHPDSPLHQHALPSKPRQTLLKGYLPSLGFSATLSDPAHCVSQLCPWLAILTLTKWLPDAPSPLTHRRVGVGGVQLEHHGLSNEWESFFPRNARKASHSVSLIQTGLSLHWFILESIIVKRDNMIISSLNKSSVVERMLERQTVHWNLSDCVHMSTPTVYKAHLLGITITC